MCRREVARTALGLAAAGAALSFAAAPAQGQTASDIDALNLVLNIEYLMAQFTTAIIGVGATTGTTPRIAAVPADRINGNGIAGTAPLLGAGPLVFRDTGLRTVIYEMASDNRNQLVPLRVVVGGLVARQPLMDLSTGAASPFATLMQRAGVVSTGGAAFNPYLSEEDMLYALFFLKNVSVAAFRGLMGGLSNKVVTQNFIGILGTEMIHLASIRTFLYTRGTAVRSNADRIAAFQNTLNGGGIFQGIGLQSRSSVVSSASVTVANLTPATNGEMAGRSSGQVLNQLYLTNTVATAGGFFPEGVNGNLRSSAGA